MRRRRTVRPIRAAANRKSPSPGTARLRRGRVFCCTDVKATPSEVRFTPAAAVIIEAVRRVDKLPRKDQERDERRDAGVDAVYSLYFVIHLDL